MDKITYEWLYETSLGNSISPLDKIKKILHTIEPNNTLEAKRLKMVYENLNKLEEYITKIEEEKNILSQEIDTLRNFADEAL